VRATTTTTRASCSQSSLALQVKNTFIHIESELGGDDEDEDESEEGFNSNARPMRRRFFSDDVASGRMASDRSATRPSTVNVLGKPNEVAKELFDVGTEIEIIGLEQNPSFNGSIGTVLSWDAKSNRYCVILSNSSTPSGRFLLKQENIIVRRDSCPSMTPRVGPVEPNGRFELEPGVGSSDGISCVPTWQQEAKQPDEANVLFTTVPRDSPSKSSPMPLYSSDAAEGRAYLAQWYPTADTDWWTAMNWSPDWHASC
jgi:hypothetical protein